MKKFVSLILSLAFAGSTFAQMSGYSSSSYSDGTTLGANETLTADGIALGNAVKLRGYVNTILSRDDDGNSAYDNTFVNADVDFLIDLSPVTAEVHIAAGDSSAGSGNDASLEQAFGRYSFNQDFHLTFGRQVTQWGFDSDEFTNRFAVTTAYGIESRKSYVDGLRLNYNNGMFGLIFGIHDHYGLASLIDQAGTTSDFNDGIAVDLAASVMFFPGLEARLGLANENGTADDDILGINGWVAWNPGDLTLAFEFDNVDGGSDDAWDIMLLGHYQFSSLIGASLRYAHLEKEVSNIESQQDRISLALLLSITENFDINFEYTHVESEQGSNETDSDELYLQALLSY
jgi:hypothetical protein